MKIITEQAQPVRRLRRNVPANVEAALEKALEKTPADRFESARAFADALVDAHFVTTHSAVNRLRSSAGMSISRTMAVGAAVALVAVGAAAVAFLRPAPSAPVRRTNVMLWDDQRGIQLRVARALAISPDGHTIVYLDSSATGMVLMARHEDSADGVPIPGTEGAYDLSAPVFSPDGRWIAFATADGKLKKVPRDGGPAVTITDGPAMQSIAWLDNGMIAYSTPTLDMRAVSQDGGPSTVAWKQHAVDTTDRMGVTMTALPGPRILVGECTPSCRTSDLLAVDLDTKATKVVATDAIKGWWLPGGVLAFVRRDGKVMAGPFDPKAMAFTAPPAAMFDGVRTTTNSASMAVSAGALVYAPGSATTESLVIPVWVSRSGVATPIDSAWRLNLSGQRGNALALSPDGTRLAIVVDRPSADGHDIWVKQVDRAPFAMTKITSEGERVSPTWTPDGRFLLFSNGGPSDLPTSSLFRRRADGAGPVDTLVTLERGIISVALTPDPATFLLRLTAPPSIDVVRWHAGSNATEDILANPAHDEGSPSLSPDGRWIAYSSSETGRVETYVRPYPGVHDDHWQVSQAGGYHPFWSHSGRELFFRNRAGSLVAAEVLAGRTFSVGRQTVLFSMLPYLLSNTTAYSAVAISADDQRFIMLRLASQDLHRRTDVERVVQIDNWPAEVRAKIRSRAP